MNTGRGIFIRMMRIAMYGGLAYALYTYGNIGYMLTFMFLILLMDIDAMHVDFAEYKHKAEQDRKNFFGNAKRKGF